MFFALLVLIIITLGGFALTYFYDKNAPFFVRLCAGAVIGQVAFSLASFIVGSLVGISSALYALSAVIAALPLLALISPKVAANVRNDFADFAAGVKSFFARPSSGQTVWSVVWLLLLVFLCFFFQRAMFAVEGGIATGSIHNVGDLSFHLQGIYSFLDGQNFPPQNPSFAGTKFTYPFMADLVTAGLAAVGAKISEAMFWQNMFLVVALIVLLRHFTFKITGNKFAANIAPLILLFDGGVGFLSFFKHALESEAGAVGYLFKMVEDYTIRSASIWRWGNSLTTLFMTQRSILLGMPLALIILTKVWEIFSAEDTREEEKRIEEETRQGDEEKSNDNSPLALSPFHSFTPSTFLPVFTVGLLAGTLPLVHAHSFAVVMGMTGLLALMTWRRWRVWLAFFIGSAVVSLPELLWAVAGSATKAQSFIGEQFGWDNNGELSFIPFWLINTGLFIPLLLLAIVLLTVKSSRFKSENPNARSPLTLLLLFWLPFALCFIIPNVIRLAPWIWDNVKVLIYWFLLSIPLVAWLLAQIWERGVVGKAVTLALLFVLMFSGWLDVWRIASGQIEFVVFPRDAVNLAREARQLLPPNAVVASASERSAAAAIMGRRWFLGYTGHVWSHGIDPEPRENILKEIYFGGQNADKLLREHNIQYLVVSPEEYRVMVVNEVHLRRFPVIAQSGDYRLLQVK